MSQRQESNVEPPHEPTQKCTGETTAYVCVAGGRMVYSVDELARFPSWHEAERGEPVEWQPISNAPRDGTTVDLWVVCDDCQFRATDFYWSDQSADWVSDASDDILSAHVGNMNPQATHWRPRPAPPRGYERGLRIRGE